MRLAFLLNPTKYRSELLRHAEDRTPEEYVDFIWKSRGLSEVKPLGDWPFRRHDDNVIAFPHQGGFFYGG